MTTAPQQSRQTPIQLASYHALRSKLQKIFFAGQQKINRAKAETYWKVGKTINDLVDRARTPYLAKGKHVVLGLSQDLNISKELLYKCMQFAEKYPHLSTSTNVEWSHYTELLSVENPMLRAKLLEQTSKENWPVKKLRGEIQKIEDRKKKLEKFPRVASNLQPPTSFLKPRLGKLHTYRVISGQEFGFEDNGERLLDHGFRFFSSLQKLEERSKKLEEIFLTPNPHPLTSLTSGSVVHLENGKLAKSDRADNDRYFYPAKVEKGIDGDTFWAVIDCGLGQTTEQKLRLRGINAVEAGQYGAKKATQFLNALLPPGSEILLKTSKSPNHDRFVADVYVSKERVESRKEKVERIQKMFFSLPAALLVSIENQGYVFVNNLLLALGLAKRMDE